MNISPNMVSAADAVRSLMVRERDRLGITFADGMAVAKDVFISMNIRGIKSSKRFAVRVNKDLNSIELPDDYLQFSTIYTYREGKIFPLFVNPNLSEEIIDLSAKKQCDCGCDLCANVKNYELIQSVVVMPEPGGSEKSFTKTIRKKVNMDGSYVMETRQPVMRYSNGVHVATVMETSEDFLCSLDIDEKGCICDTHENREKIYADCGFCDIRHECGAPALPGEDCYNPTFNISDDGRRIILPSNHSYDNLVVRYYYDLKTRDIMVPQVCKRLFMLEVLDALIELDPKVPQYYKKQVSNLITVARRDMLSDISMLTISRIYKAIYPKRY